MTLRNRLCKPNTKTLSVSFGYLCPGRDDYDITLGTGTSELGVQEPYGRLEMSQSLI